MTNERQTFTYRETNDGGSVVDETIERQYRGFWHREFSMTHTGDRFPVDRVRTEYWRTLACDMRIIVRHASAIDVRMYGPGKYRTYTDAYVDACVLAGFADETIGDTQTNGAHYARVNGPIVDFVERTDDLTNAEVRWLDESASAGAIVQTTDQGFVGVQYFTDSADLDRVWDRIVAELEECDVPRTRTNAMPRTQQYCCDERHDAPCRLPCVACAEECDHDAARSVDEPGEGDLTTEDDRAFYQYGRKVLYWFADYRSWQYWDPTARNFRPLYPADRVQSADESERAIVDYCNRVQYWPNVWRISDHGNAHRLTIAEVSE